MYVFSLWTPPCFDESGPNLAHVLGYQKNNKLVRNTQGNRN